MRFQFQDAALFAALLQHSFSHASPLANRDYNTDASSYDFIIVGGGTAGLALANRLTESGDQSVLVLEAGQEPNTVAYYRVPALNGETLGTTIDWGFVTKPQKTLNGRTITYHRGRCLGGSSAVNGLTYTRRSSSIYDLWQSLGNTGWSWKDVFPLFKKSTSAVSYEGEISFQSFNQSVYSDGPVQVGYPDFALPASVDFVKALAAIGVSPTADLNTGVNQGAKEECLTIDKNHLRSSSYDSYYQLAKDRPNLKVMTLAQVQQVILERQGADITATGVVVLDQKDGVWKNFTAKREVILSAGSFQSPQLLMLSGIGPHNVLKSVGIPVMLENGNVGQHLQDHNYFSLNIRVDPSTSWTNLFGNVYNMQQAQQEFTATHSGPYTAAPGPAFGFQKLSKEVLESLSATELLTSRHDQAHIEWLFETAFYPFIPMPNNYVPQPNESYISVTAGIVAPVSRGSVTLQSASILDAPVIDLNYFEAETDRNLAVYAFKQLRKIAAHPALKQYSVGPNNGEVSPGIETQSNEDILNYIRNTAIPIWHVSGTCRMLPRDKGGVVDDRLRVHGVKGLRVVDASVFPVIPDCHTQGPVYMVAEKAAQMIREDWGF